MSFTDQIQQLLLSFGKRFRTKPVQDSSRKQLVQRDAVLNTNHLGNTTARTIISQTTDCYFEDYEKQYYIFQILNLLTQIQEYEEFMDSNKSGVVFMHLEIPKPKCNGLSTTSTFSIDPSLTHVTPSIVTPNTMSSQKMSPTTEGYRRSNWDKRNA